MLLDPDGAPEHHKRSSSMRVTGSTYRGCVRERSSDDCIIGTHLGMGMLPRETGSDALHDKTVWFCRRSVIEIEMIAYELI